MLDEGEGKEGIERGKKEGRNEEPGRWKERRNRIPSIVPEG